MAAVFAEVLIEAGLFSSFIFVGLVRYVVGFDLRIGQYLVYDLFSFHDFVSRIAYCVLGIAFAALDGGSGFRPGNPEEQHKQGYKQAEDGVHFDHNGEDYAGLEGHLRALGRHEDTA